MSQKVIRCPDDKLALLLEHGGLNCTSEAKAVAHGIMLDLRDCRAALAAAEAKLADEKASRIGWAESSERWRNHYYETLALLADERRHADALAGALRDALENLRSATDALMGDSDLDDDESPEMLAMQAAAAVLSQTPAASLRSHDAEVLERAAVFVGDRAASQARERELREDLLRIEMGCSCGCDDFAAKALARPVDNAALREMLGECATDAVDRYIADGCTASEAASAAVSRLLGGGK